MLFPPARWRHKEKVPLLLQYQKRRKAILIFLSVVIRYIFLLAVDALLSATQLSGAQSRADCV